MAAVTSRRRFTSRLRAVVEVLESRELLSVNWAQIDALTSNPAVGTAVDFSISASSNDGQPITGAQVDFGDGSMPQAFGAGGNSFTFSHIYSNTGWFNVSAQVTDADDSSQGTGYNVNCDVYVGQPSIAPPLLSVNNLQLMAGDSSAQTFGVINSASGQPGDYSASMTVDGNSYPLSVNPDGGDDLLQGNVAGLSDGTHSANVSVNQDTDGMSASTSGSFTIDVIEPAPTLSGYGISTSDATVGVPWSGTVANFSASGSMQLNDSDMVGATNFGDSTSTVHSTNDDNSNGSVSVIDTGSNTWSLYDSHTFNDPGSFTLSSTLTHTPSGASAAVSTSLNAIQVNLAAFSVSGTSLSINEGDTPAYIGTLIDSTGASANISNYSGSVYVNGQYYGASFTRDPNNPGQFFISSNFSLSDSGSYSGWIAVTEQVAGNNQIDTSGASFSIDVAPLPVPQPTITATVVSDSEIDLTINGCNGWMQLTGSDGTSTSFWYWGDGYTFQDTGITPGTACSYQATSEQSGLQASTVASTPFDITNITASQAGPNGIDLSWAFNGNTAPIQIERSSDGGNSWTLLGINPDAGTSEIEDGNLPDGVTYQYQIQAMNSNWVGEGPWALAATVSLPALVSDLQATQVSSSEVDLSWTNNGVSAIDISYSTNGGSTYSSPIIVSGVNAYDITDLPTGQSCCFQIQEDGPTAGPYTLSADASATSPITVSPPIISDTPPPAPTLFVAAAFACAGEDGNGTAAAEIVTQQTEADAPIMWDPSDDAGGFDSGSVGAEFSYDGVQGQSTWSLPSEYASPLQIASPIGTISQVNLQLGLTVANAEVSWSNIQITFYSQNGDSQTVTPSSIDLSTFGAKSSGGVDLEIQSSQPYTSVTVSGEIRLVCPDGTYPNPDSLYAAVFIS